MATMQAKVKSKTTDKAANKEAPLTEAASKEASPPQEASLPREPLPKIPACPGIEDFGDRVSFLGVEVMKGKGGPRTPSIARFEKNSLTEWDLEFMQKIAISLALRDPILIEAGSGIGKSTGVERVCAYLNMECYYANCAEYDLEVLMGSRTIAKDGSVEWRDGIIPKWIRNGGVLFLDEYNFMRANVRGRLHEVLDSIIRDTGKINLTENYDEIISLHPDCRIVAAQNEPGGSNAGREVLDAAQITRFVYIKELEELPKELKIARALGSINGDLYTPKANQALYLNTQEAPVPLHDIPGIKELVVRFIEFDAAIAECVRTRQLGSKQSQPVHFSTDRDRKRVFKFLET
jgi:MoxR-like ATPase